MSARGDAGGPGGYDPARQPACARHPERTTGLTCARCGRPSCPECLREASVGFQCVDCVREGSRGVRTGRTITGARSGGSDTAVVVPGLIVVNVAVFLLTAIEAGSLANNGQSELFYDWMLYPPAVAVGQWWRLLTAGFLHIGPIHLTFNMLALYFIGRDMELVLGRGRFLTVYLVSLLGGAAAAFVLGSPEAPVAGASGAVFGLMGGLAVVLRRLRHSPRPAITLILVNVAISVLIPNISLLGHLGGLVVGAAITAALVYAPRARQLAWEAGAVAAVVALLVMVMAMRAAALSTGFG